MGDPQPPDSRLPCMYILHNSVGLPIGNTFCRTPLASRKRPISLKSLVSALHPLSSKSRGEPKMGANCAGDCASKAITEIIVVRHGETISNAFGIYQGQSESDLNELGRRQAVAVADRLSKESNISVVYSSDLKRASDTAKIIAEKCGLQLLLNPSLRERHLGRLQGLAHSEAPLLEPVAYANLASKDQPILGGGESFNQLYLRSKSAFEEIANNHKGERVIVVTHGGVVRALCKLAGRHSREKVCNASITVFHVFENGDCVVHSFSDIIHLNALEALPISLGGDTNAGQSSCDSKKLTRRVQNGRLDDWEL